MTEVTIKTLPRPETETTVLLSGLDDARANAAMSAAMASSCDVSGAAHLPRGIAVAELSPAKSTTVFRLEGVAPSVKHRKDALIALLRPFAPADTLSEHQSRLVWRGIRDALPFAANTNDMLLWRVSTTPARGAEFAAKLPGEAQFYYDWAGGLVWIALPPSDDAGAAAIRSAAALTGGHATLIRAPAAIRAAVDVFEPQHGALAGVSKRVKESFDPKRVLNPGRMWAGV
jgi:glycolate oxidase FAD binding subunit